MKIWIFDIFVFVISLLFFKVLIGVNIFNCKETNTQTKHTFVF
jgi:hypothetical protein